MKPFELNDTGERQRALNPRKSFIVQAPAGSGKTELITQRFLVLLSHVKLPEEILAITFTKKSAAEMRARIIKSLKNARFEPEPESAHEKQTWRLASQALERNQQQNWNLLDNPNRLQIQTIDSFNAGLTRQLPLLSKFGAPLEIIDDANQLYRKAVHEFLSHLEENYEWVNAIEILLLHMDNDLANVEKLLMNMLAKRDQWLPYIASNVNNPELRKTLETHLQHVVTDALSTLHDVFPQELAAELIDVARFAAQNVAPDSFIANCAELTTLPGVKSQDKKFWSGIADLLLKKDDDWRKTITKEQGFPAPSSSKNASEKSLLTQYKKRMEEILQELNQEEELLQAFQEFRSLPEATYNLAQWETLEALHSVLRVVVAQLNLIFQEHGKIDYIENAQAAFHALGSDDAPTDITLALDYKIQHILIDEFQDTSNSQYRLLEKLIAGWDGQDGRTLFVVGDPMQSIYRFREAEVGLFIRARKKGIAHLPLEPLTLSVNFRSLPGVVNWVNEHFTRVFPSFEDIASGAVSYSPSTANQTTSTDTAVVKLHPFIDANENTEADRIIKVIHEARVAYPTGKIAILVRSRTHLKAIIPALKAAQLAFRALDIEPLSTRPVIQDLLALTRALLHPADRIAWLAVLRAPWCGLSLSDLLVIASEKSKMIIWEQLRSAEVLAKLNPDSQQRLKRILPVFEISLAERRRYSVRQWIENTWLSLGGPACVEQQADLEDARSFFKLLEKLDDAYDLTDLKRFNDAMNKLYAAPNNLADDLLQIMTIHNAKGLEFDTVILPHLERKASQDEKQLLQWMERPRADDRSDLILAPIHAVGEKSNLIYDYIKRQQNVRTEYENGRLLYVAATRAKKQLHLFFNLKSNENNAFELKNPAPNSLLHKLWPSIQAYIKNHVTQATASIKPATEAETNPKAIRRLTAHWHNPVSENLFTAATGFHQKKSGFNLPQNNPKYIGTLIHQILQQISQLGIDWWQQHSTTTQQAYLQNHFLQLGMKLTDVQHALPVVEQALRNTLADTRGQWILQQHTQSQSELPLTAVINGKTKNIIIDRTFIDEAGTRWIIDYKSVEFTGNDLEGFLQAEKAQYEQQLWEYQLAMKNLDARPIRVGLYFPMIPAWKEWSF